MAKVRGGLFAKVPATFQRGTYPESLLAVLKPSCNIKALGTGSTMDTCDFKRPDFQEHGFLIHNENLSDFQSLLVLDLKFSSLRYLKYFFTSHCGFFNGCFVFITNWKHCGSSFEVMEMCLFPF